MRGKNLVTLDVTWACDLPQRNINANLRVVESQVKAIVGRRRFSVSYNDHFVVTIEVFGPSLSLSQRKELEEVFA